MRIANSLTPSLQRLKKPSCLGLHRIAAALQGMDATFTGRVPRRLLRITKLLDCLMA